MAAFAKPRVVASRCLGFAHCRYNGAMISDDFVSSLREHVEFIPVCPEMEIGLGVPRDPIRIISDRDGLCLIQPSTGRDVTEAMGSFAARFLDSLPDVDGFILKTRSPSCGLRDAKLFNKKGRVIGKGSGIFTRAALIRHPDTAIESEGRLTDPAIREHFLIRIFTRARFREVRDSGSPGNLVHFQSVNKLLFMTYNQRIMRELGRIAANTEHRPAREVISEYDCLLPGVFSRAATRAAHINTLMHALGYFSDRLSSGEKAFFLKELERFRNLKIPLSALIAVVQSWISRFGEQYLEAQTYFHPYPEALVEVSQS